jgi:hypothetical protein
MRKAICKLLTRIGSVSTVRAKSCYPDVTTNDARRRGSCLAIDAIKQDRESWEF